MRASCTRAAQVATKSSAPLSSPPAKSSKAQGFKSNHPQWMPELVKQLHLVSSDASWLNLVDSWLLLEEAIKDSKGLLPTFERPEQVFWWNKRGKHTSSIPDLSRGDVLTTFCNKWDAWYNSMQPEWHQREDGLPMDKTVGRGGFEGLAIGSSNGFLVIVMTIA
ncbi:hypothetical protein EWM64_g7702 [Hericium alpestre]|uniref:Uncharacterized protein n=1 Tax=Hericium alpestre TaxID=135208 RepID=A0A4Y9ZPY7_9AGAM|nr:hypothetical protein EWM64_g7702 [Hericium alpestre]